MDVQNKAECLEESQNAKHFALNDLFQQLLVVLSLCGLVKNNGGDSFANGRQPSADRNEAVTSTDGEHM
ncbi:hypothetical protein V3C99_016875 [Haemonchus contortus]